MRGAAQLATYIAWAMILAGFGVIYLAWNGAAELDYVQGQFPYLLSGGLTGLGLIVAGSGVLAVQTVRGLSAQRGGQMRAVNEAMDGLLAAVRTGQRPKTGVAAGPPGGPRDEAGQPVVAGRSSFHQPACHLVAGRADLEDVSREVAEQRGLAACRVCKP